MSRLSPPKKQKVTENKGNKSDDEYKIIRLSIDGVEDDPNEPDICLTEEELQAYILKKMVEFQKDPEYNPVLKLKQETRQLKKDMEEKCEELEKLKILYERLYKDREKFLRHVGSLPKVTTHDVAIGVDLPILPELVPKGAKKLFGIPTSSSSSSAAESDDETDESE